MAMTFKYGASFPHQPVVPELGTKIVSVYDVPFPPRPQATPGTGKSDNPAQVAYDRGLMEGRRQILMWMKEELDMFIPMASPTAMGALLIEGLRGQVDKYLLSGGNPLEKTEESSGG